MSSRDGLDGAVTEPHQWGDNCGGRLKAGLIRIRTPGTTSWDRDTFHVGSHLAGGDFTRARLHGARVAIGNEDREEVQYRATPLARAGDDGGRGDDDGDVGLVKQREVWTGSAK